MPIKSLFVPPYAIQGEEIPAHIIWDSLDYSLIKIEIPSDVIKLKEIYNVKDEMIDISDNLIKIRKVEVEGYLGMLFSTTKLKECSKSFHVNFSFFGKNGEKIVDETRDIVLFRPQLRLEEVPNVIKVDTEKALVYNKIRIRKIGQGTLIVNFNTPKDSEIQKIIPDSISSFLANFRKDAEANLEEVKKRFPQHSALLDRYINLIVNGWTTYEELDDAKKLLKELHTVLIENEQLLEALFYAIAQAVSKNLKLFTLPESLLRYIDSIAAYKVWLAYPWYIIPIHKEPKNLELELLLTDLLLDKYEPIRLRLKIYGTKEGYLELARLFKWEEQK